MKYVQDKHACHIFCTKISAGSDGLRWEALITFHGMTRLISDKTHNILLNNDTVIHLDEWKQITGRLNMSAHKKKKKK